MNVNFRTRLPVLRHVMAESREVSFWLSGVNRLVSGSFLRAEGYDCGMEAFGLLIIVVGLVAGAGGVGFLLGFFVGRWSASKKRQAGFPVLQTTNESMTGQRGKPMA